MKKLLTLSLMFIALFTAANSIHVSASSVSTCEAPPQLYNIGTSVWDVSEGDSFTLSVTFYNSCNHIIKNVLINSKLHTADLESANPIVSQGTTSTILPGGQMAYTINIPMVYTASMGTSFTVTHFTYSVWLNTIMPIDHVAVVNTSFDNPLLQDPSPDDLPSENTTEITFRVEYVADGLLITNEATEQSETWTFDAIFYSSLAAQYLGDQVEFLVDPIGSLNSYYKYALDNSQSSSVFSGDFVTDTVYDILLADDGFTDAFIDAGTDSVFTSLQESNINYVFPGGYYWFDGSLQEIKLTDEGLPEFDDDGNVQKLEDGNTAGELPDANTPWVLDPDSWLGRAVANFGESINEALGIDWGWVKGVEYTVNNIGFILGLIVIAVILVFTFGLWWPFAQAFASMLFTILITMFGWFRSFIKLGGKQIADNTGKNSKYKIKKMKRAKY